MKTLKFIKGPGYLYDLLTLFILYFNQERFLAEQVNLNKVTEDNEHFSQILNTIEKVPEELRIFFHLKENNTCFLSTYYFFNNMEQIFEGSSTEGIQNSLKNYNKVIEDVANYYLGIDPADASVDDPEFIRTTGKKIRDSAHSLVLKNNLYEFFLDPIPVIQTLCNELAKKDILLSKLYNEKDITITKVQNSIDLHQLIESTLQTKNNKLDVSSINDFIISICVAHKNCSIAFTSDSKMLLLLGTDYEEFLNYMRTKDRSPELSQFGIALTEPNRIQMLELILRNGEMTVSDLKKELQISHTNAYYHVSLLLKANLLAFRNCGRMIYYRINHAYFRDICTILGKFAQEGGAER